MKRKILTFAFLVFVAISVTARDVFAFDGPPQYVNPFPITRWLAVPFYDTAVPQDKLSASLSHSSIYLDKRSAHYRLLLDMEITELNVVAGKKINDTIEAGIVLPVVMYSSGVMDSVINSYHSAFGFPDYGRSEAPANRFAYIFEKDGRRIVRANNGQPFVGDITLYGKKLVYESKAVTTAVRFEGKLPTGNARAGEGSGTFSGGLTVLNDIVLHDIVMLYVGLGAAIPGGFHGETHCDTEPVYHGSAAVEVMLPKEFSFLMQITGQTSPIQDTGIAVIDGPYAGFVAGFRKKMKDLSFELFFSEDLNTRGGPDFGLTLAVKKSF